jgi:hypothetical protein
MNSFLTFRNWYRSDDISKVLAKYPAIFEQFFLAAGFSPDFSTLAVKHVFAYHTKNFNKHSGLIGKMKNRWLDFQLKKNIQNENGYR